MAPSDGSPLGDIPDDELSSLVDDVLQSGKHATSQGKQAAPPGAKKSDERLHAGVIQNKSQASIAPPQRAATTGSDEDRWFFEVRGKQLGPVTLAEVGKLWSDGKLDSTAYCWNAKFSAWIPLAKITALAKAITPAEESKAPVAPAAAIAATVAAVVPSAAAASSAVAPVAAGPAVGGAASGENASAASTGSPDNMPAVPDGPSAPAEVVTFVRATPRVVVESVVPGSFEEDDFAPRQRMPSWFKQSLLTGLVAGGIMAAIVVTAQRTTSSGRDASPGNGDPATRAVVATPATGTAATAAMTASASTNDAASSAGNATPQPALASAAGATTAELQTHQAPAAPKLAVTSGTAPAPEPTRSLVTSASEEPAAPRVAVRPPTWTAPPPRTPAPPITASAPRPRTSSQNASAQEEAPGPQDEFGPTAFAREFKETPPNPPKRTVYIPPAPGSGPLPEQLTTTELEAVAESHQAEVRRCIDAHRPLSGPGEIRMRWTLSTDGTVSGARAITGGLQDGALATCLAGAISTWKFPAHQKQMAPVELPFPY